jgi:hypothetical protein
LPCLSSVMYAGLATHYICGWLGKSWRCHLSVLSFAFFVKFQTACFDTDNSMMPDDHCTFGSNILSWPARYHSWESPDVADTERSQVQYFDGIWKSLANRSMKCVYKAANLWGHGDRPVSQDGKRQRT